MDLEAFVIIQFATSVPSLTLRNNWLPILLAVIFIVAIIGLGWHAPQSDFQSILTFYLPAFAVYFFFLNHKVHSNNIAILIGVAILARCILVFAFPLLSDDVFRFIWDGQLWNSGMNPFDQLPRYWMEQGNLFPNQPELFEALNSKAYYTIYPPVCQGIFTFATFICPQSIYFSSVVMKIFLLLFEIGSILLIMALLKEFKLDASKVLIYALNPLVIVEVCGNLHFEGAMVFFFLLSIYLFKRKKDFTGSLAFALSVASKLLPLMLLPLILVLLGKKRLLKVLAYIGISLLLLFLPIYSSQFIESFSGSLDLYFRKFEFNASIYYLLRSIGELVSGYNMIKYIGPALAGVAGLSILYLARRGKENNYPSFFKLAGLSFCVYLLCATTIHPWYLILPLALLSFTSFRFIILWTLLIFGTYYNYAFDPYAEQLYIVIIEYLAVGVLCFWEMKQLDRTQLAK